jgi:hypothetical protein
VNPITLLLQRLTVLAARIHVHITEAWQGKYRPTALCVCDWIHIVRTIMINFVSVSCQVRLSLLHSLCQKVLNVFLCVPSLHIVRILKLNDCDKRCEAY